MSSLPLFQFQQLCELCNRQDDFQVKRIDLTCDFFPCQGLNLKPWETYLDQGQLADYRSVKRILNSDRGDCSSTVYLGSRRSESMVRLYSKNIEGKLWDRWELELKGYKADQAVERFVKQGVRPLLEILLGSITLLNQSWFDEFKFSEGIKLFARQEETNLERSIKFLWSISASLAMIQCFM
ncbi:MAG: replication initiation factor domain-containing protein, partial [Planktothrix sp.]